MGILVTENFVFGRALRGDPLGDDRNCANIHAANHSSVGSRGIKACGRRFFIAAYFTRYA